MSGAARTWRWLLAALIPVSAIALLAACDDDWSSIEITNARARFTTTDVGAVYFDITAEGADDRLIAAASGIAADVQVHEVVSEGGGSMMRPVADGIAITAGGTVSLEPGGYHLMLLGVGEIPVPGDSFELTLQFERAGRIAVTVTVEAFGGDDGMEDMDHGSMDEGE